MDMIFMANEVPKEMQYVLILVVVGDEGCEC